MNRNKIAVMLLIGMGLVMLLPVRAHAHVVVLPGEETPATSTIFSVHVPNERSESTVGVRLIIPDELEYVTPIVKTGWTVTIEQEDEAPADMHADGKITSLSWTGGTIPDGQKDIFSFSAKTPAQSGQLTWKAYQTYADGMVVSWDKSADEQPRKSDGSPDYSTSGPFSVTAIADTEPVVSGNQAENRRSLIVAVLALAVSLMSLGIVTSQKKRSRN